MTIWVSLSFSQSDKHIIDSLKTQLSIKQSDTSRVKLLNAISTRYFTVAPATGINYAQEALKLSQKIKWKKGQAGAYRALGTNYWALKNFIKAQDYFWRALKIAEGMNDKALIALSIHSLGVLHNANADYLKSLEYYSSALQIFKELRDTGAMAGCYSNMASMYEALDKKDECLNAYHNALELAKILNNQYSIAYYKGRLGATFFRMSRIDSALIYEKDAYRIFKLLRDTLNMADMVGEMGHVYSSLGKNKEAVLQYENAIRLFRTIHGIEGIANVARYKSYISEIYLKQSENESSRNKSHLLVKAENLLQESVHGADSAKYIEGLAHFYQLLSQVYEKQNRSSLAFSAYKKYIQLKDSITSFEKVKEMTKNELAYAFEKQKDSLAHSATLKKKELEAAVKEEQLSNIKFKEKWLFTVIGALLIVVTGIILALYYRMRSLQFKNQALKDKSDQRLKEIKLEKKLREADIAAIRAQLNPHFMFNSLNAIQELIISDKGEESQIYLERFANLLRSLLENADQPFISLRKELNFIELYLSLEKLRMPDLKYEINIDPVVDIDRVVIPNMVLQPYLENSLWHGLRHKVGEKLLELNIIESGDKINYQIKDNGIGRQKSGDINNKNGKIYKSRGMELLAKRFSLLSEEYESEVIVEIRDAVESGPDTGTIVNVSMPARIGKEKLNI